MKPLTFLRLMGTAFVLLIAVAAVLASYFTVEQYERGVVTSWGRINYIADPGLHFKVPFRDDVHTIRTDILNIQPSKGVNTYTIDNQEVDVIFNVFYRIPPSKVAFVYENVPDYKARVLNIAVDRLKSEMGKINVTHVAQQRGTVRDAIHTVLAKDALELGVEVTDFQLSNIEYTPQFKVVVEQAAAARQGVETREQEKQQAIKVAERAKIQAEGEANAAREKARGDADARLLVAEAEAKSIRLKGEAEAAAIKAQAEALAQNANLVELRKAERWNGTLPQNIYANAPIPFLNVK